MTGTADAPRDGQHRRHRGMRPVVVFTPWPVLTVTIESGADNEDHIHFHAGGQGVWIARMIESLGHDAMLVGPFGHGSGAVVEALLRAEGIDVRAIPVGQRTGAYVNDRRKGAREELARMWPAPLDRHEMDDLFDAALTSALDAGHCVLTGSADERFIAPDIISRLAVDLAGAGIDVTADLSRASLTELRGGVSCLKVSHEELIGAGFSTENTLPDLMAGVGRLGARAAGDVIVSRAADGALARLDGAFVEATAPRLTAFDHTGAGDSMTAALAIARVEGMTRTDALKFAVAAGAINVTRHGRGTGNRADIEVVATRVNIRPLD